MYSLMKIEFDPLTAYLAEELVHLTVALPKEVIAAIDEALEALPSVKNRERFIAFAVLFALSDIEQNAAWLDRS
jgi:hypothetical protein